MVNRFDVPQIFSKKHLDAEWNCAFTSKYQSFRHHLRNRSCSVFSPKLKWSKKIAFHIIINFILEDLKSKHRIYAEIQWKSNSCLLHRYNGIFSSLLHFVFYTTTSTWCCCRHESFDSSKRCRCQCWCFVQFISFAVLFYFCFCYLFSLPRFFHVQRIDRRRTKMQPSKKQNT